MSSAQLLVVQQLAARLSEPDLLALDCRFVLEGPSYDTRVYQENHIPGAYFTGLGRDLSVPVRKDVTGRHPLPNPAELALKLQAWGLRQDSQVVLYDDSSGAFAAHTWWLLHWLGEYDGVYLLDGGLAVWKAAGLTLTNGESSLRPGGFQDQPDVSLLIDATTLQAQLGQPGLALLDTRTQPRFRGEIEPIDPVAGHIPSAQCAAFTDSPGSNSRLLSSEQLHQWFSALLHGRLVGELIAYCGFGVTACHNLFALSLTGFPLPRLYTGSWSKWVTDPRHLIIIGS